MDCDGLASAGSISSGLLVCQLQSIACCAVFFLRNACNILVVRDRGAHLMIVNIRLRHRLTIFDVDFAYASTFVDHVQSFL